MFLSIARKKQSTTLSKQENPSYMKYHRKTPQKKKHGHITQLSRYQWRKRKQQNEKTRKWENERRITQWTQAIVTH